MVNGEGGSKEKRGRNDAEREEVLLSEQVVETFATAHAEHNQSQIGYLWASGRTHLGGK